MTGKISPAKRLWRRPAWRVHQAAGFPVALRFQQESEFPVIGPELAVQTEGRPGVQGCVGRQAEEKENIERLDPGRRQALRGASEALQPESEQVSAGQEEIKLVAHKVKRIMVGRAEDRREISQPEKQHRQEGAVPAGLFPVDEAAEQRARQGEQKKEQADGGRRSAYDYGGLRAGVFGRGQARAERDSQVARSQLTAGAGR